MDASVREYSMGMRQRLGIANALLGKPSTVILDEPINGLDPQGIVEVRDLIGRLNKDGTTLLVSSHILSELALVANRFGFTDAGRLVTELSKEELEVATETGTLEIGTDTPERTRVFLVSSLGLASASLAEGGRLVTVPVTAGMDVAQIAAAIIADGQRLHELHVARLSLEDYYFSLTQGASDA